MRALTAGDGAEDNERLFAVGNVVGERDGGFCERVIFFTGEVAEVGTPLERHVIADGSAQHWIASLERVEDGLRRYRSVDLKRNFGADFRQIPEVIEDLL